MFLYVFIAARRTGPFSMERGSITDRLLPDRAARKREQGDQCGVQGDASTRTNDAGNVGGRQDLTGELGQGETGTCA